MSEPKRVQVVLENLSNQARSFYLEPYGYWCELSPNAKVHATWDVPSGGEAELEISIVDDGVIIGDASKPMHELQPDREGYGAHLWQ